MVFKSQFQHCGDLNDTQLKVLNLTMSVSGGLGALITVIMFAVLIYAKAYGSVLQRLFLYSVLATMMHELLHVAQIEHQFQYKWQNQVCAHLGFLSNWSGWVIYIFNLDIILFLLLIVYQQLKGDIMPRLSKSKSFRTLTECLCVIGSIGFPVVVIWVPYKEKNYGLNEAYCYIRAFDDNCTEIGIKDKLLYAYSFYEVVGLLAILIAIGIGIVYCTLSTILFINAKRLLRQVMILVLFVIIYMVILNIMLVVDIVVDTSYYLNIFFAIAATMTDLMFLFGYLLAFHSTKLRRKFQSKRKRGFEKVSPRDQRCTKEYGTFEESNRVTRPSKTVTYFDVPYTGEFTSVPT